MSHSVSLRSAQRYFLENHRDGDGDSYETFSLLDIGCFFWYSEQLPVLRDQAAMGLCKKKDYVLTTQAMSGVLMREEILRLNNHYPLQFEPPGPKQQRAIQQRLHVVN